MKKCPKVTENLKLGSPEKIVNKLVTNYYMKLLYEISVKNRKIEKKQNLPQKNFTAKIENFLHFHSELSSSAQYLNKLCKISHNSFEYFILLVRSPFDTLFLCCLAV